LTKRNPENFNFYTIIKKKTMFYFNDYERFPWTNKKNFIGTYDPFKKSAFVEKKIGNIQKSSIQTVFF
jgi:hypothetical protein